MLNCLYRKLFSERFCPLFLSLLYQGTHCLLTKCLFRFEKKLNNSTQQPIKRKLTQSPSKPLGIAVSKLQMPGPHEVEVTRLHLDLVARKPIFGVSAKKI